MKPWMWLLLFVLTALGSFYLLKKPKTQVTPVEMQGLNPEGTPEFVSPPTVPSPVKPESAQQNRLPAPRPSQEPGSAPRMDMGSPSESMESLVPPPIPSEPVSPEAGVPPPPVYPYPESEPPPEYFEGDQNPPSFEAPPPLEEGEGVIPPVIEGSP